MVKRVIGTVLVMSFLMVGCGERENDPVEASSDNLSLALEQAIEYSVIPAVEAMSAAAMSLSSAANTFCVNRNNANLITLQTRWKTVFVRWYALANYNFGPLNDDIIFPKINVIDSLRLRGTDYTATVRTEIANDLLNSVVLDVSYFDGKTFQKVGLLALESLVFETVSSEHSKTATDIVAEFESEARKCEMLLGLIAHLRKQTDYVQIGWLSDFNNTGVSFQNVFVNNQIEGGVESLTLLITSVQENLDYLKKRNVVTTAGQISSHSWVALAAAISEVEILLFGTASTTVSFISLMEVTGFQVAIGSVKSNIVEIRQSIENEDAVMLDIALGKLDGNFKREIPDGLEVELGINFTDGD